MSSDRSVSEYYSAYHDWWRRALDSTLLVRALSQYYAEDLSSHGYVFSLDDTTYEIPVITSPSWVSPTVADFRLTPTDGEFPPREDAAALTEFVKPIAANNGESHRSPDPDDYLWNGTIYGANDLDLNADRLMLSRMTFYTAATRFQRLRDELYRSLYEAGVGPTESGPFPSAALSGTPRDIHASTVSDLLQSDRPISTGGGAVVIINTGTEYEVVVSQRSPGSAESPGQLEIVPAGFFEPDGGDPAHLFTRHVLREFSEELLGNPEDSDALEVPAITALMDALVSGGATLQKVFAHLNLEKAHFSVFGALIIDDPSFYRTHLSEAKLGGWESSGVEFVPLSDDARLTEVLSPSHVKPMHLPGLVEALRHFEQSRDHPLPCRLSRVNPR